MERGRTPLQSGTAEGELSVQKWKGGPNHTVLAEDKLTAPKEILSAVERQWRALTRGGQGGPCIPAGRRQRPAAHLRRPHHASPKLHVQCGSPGLSPPVTKFQKQCFHRIKTHGAVKQISSCLDELMATSLAHLFITPWSMQRWHCLGTKGALDSNNPSRIENAPVWTQPGWDPGMCRFLLNEFLHLGPNALWP